MLWIRWKFCFDYIQMPMKWWLQKFAHGRTAIPSWQATKLLAIFDIEFSLPYMYIYISRERYIHTYIHTYTYTYTHIYTCICVCIYIYTYIYISQNLLILKYIVEIRLTMDILGRLGKLNSLYFCKPISCQTTLGIMHVWTIICQNGRAEVKSLDPRSS